MVGFNFVNSIWYKGHAVTAPVSIYNKFWMSYTKPMNPYLVQSKNFGLCGITECEESRDMIKCSVK